jgi:hypothetical protein
MAKISCMAIGIEEAGVVGEAERRLLQRNRTVCHIRAQTRASIRRATDLTAAAFVLHLTSKKAFQIVSAARWRSVVLRPAYIYEQVKNRHILQVCHDAQHDGCREARASPACLGCQDTILNDRQHD